MKKLIVSIAIGGAVLSCNDDFLDQVPDDRLTFEETFSSRNTTEEYLAAIYRRLPNEYAQRYTTTQNSGPWTGASDEGEYVWSFPLSNYMNIGDWNPTTGNISTLWSNFYRGIRECSTFIENIENCRDCTEANIKQYTGEVHVLRGFFYYALLRSWGPVILLGDASTNADSDVSMFKRNTIDEVVNYIVSELDTGAEALEGINFKGGNAGRMSRPFAMAIKEKALLFAASPIFNGNTDYAELTDEGGNFLIPQSPDINKWKTAADAAKAFIDEFVPGTFSLYKEYNDDGSVNGYLSCRNVMLRDWNPEMIYERPRGTFYLNYDCTPYHAGADSRVKGAGGLGLTQEFVDAFFTENGRPIDDPESGYQASGFTDFQTPYDDQSRTIFAAWANREPRFYVNVTFNNSLWLNRDHGDVITTTWYSGNSGKGSGGGNDYTPTGYIARKNIAPDGSTSRAIPMIRLAEIYLDYAEALNEYEPGNPDILKYVNLIRERAGIPLYGSSGLPQPAGQDAMREAIHRERRVELALESVRYFDLIRWKQAEDALHGPVHSMDINATDEADFYRVITFETRVFTKKHYLFPVPQGEIDANPALQQNTGW